MRRALLLSFGLIAVTWLEYQFFPGHTYLEADTQVYLPMLERLDAPGFLSRDLVATHPDVAYTIYDELTLFLHETVNVDLRTALTLQQLGCRLAAVIGVFLLAVSTGFDDVLAVIIAALLNLGAALPGPAVLLVNPEAVPLAFAFGWILLSAGLIAREKPLLAGLAGGLAVVYDPAIAAPFWAVLLMAFLLDSRLRRLLRPALTILLVFILLLANLAQLQPGVLERQDFFSTISEPFAALQQYRTKFVWVSLWAPHEIWHYLAILVCGIWAAARIWPALNRQARWLFVALPLCGIVSVPVSGLLLDRLRWSFIPQVQPARTLLYTVAFAGMSCAMAGARAALRGKAGEACLWFLLVFALPMNVRLLDLLKLTDAISVVQLLTMAVLACALGILLTRLHRSDWVSVVLLLPLAAIFLLPRIPGVATHPRIDSKPIIEVAQWAENKTWGSSMFLFPDAGRELYPGIFRAESIRALWVDWNSGTLVPYFESFAGEWWQRWQDTMQGGFSPRRLQGMLSLPIDYYVLKRANELREVTPVFRNRDFVVYDAGDLRKARAPLALTAIQGN